MAAQSNLRKLPPETDVRSGDVISHPWRPLDTEAAPGYADLVRAWTRSGMVGDMKQAIEASVVEVLARHLIANQKLDESPFDAIYLSDLRPDRIAANDITEIQQYAGIGDLSATLVLQDGWDD